MTSASFSNLSRISIAAVAAVVFSCLFPSISYAQTPAPAAQQPSGYAPPPMFDDMTPPMVRPDTQGGYIVQPKISERPVVPETDNVLTRPPVILPRVSVDPDAPKTTTTTTTTMPAPRPTLAPAAPLAPAAAPVIQAPAVPAAPSVPAPTVAAPQKPQMMKPIVDEVYIKREKPAVKKMPAIKTNDDEKTVSAPVPPKKPIAPAKTDKEPETQPVTTARPAKETAGPAQPPVAVTPVMPVAPAAPVRDPKESAITGPVEMPALPAQRVEGKVLYQPSPEDQKEPTLLERQQEQPADKKEATLVPIVPRPKDGVAPATFEPGEKQNALKKSIPFQPGQIALGSDDIDPIAAGVVKELDDEDHKDWRVQISAFATPYGTGLSSDRRIALSRALSLRTALITQGVAASKIDVRAEGLQNDGKPGDRIELYLYGPAEE